MVAAALPVGSEAVEALGLQGNGFASAEAVVAEDTGWGAGSTLVVGY